MIPALPLIAGALAAGTAAAALLGGPWWATGGVAALLALTAALRASPRPSALVLLAAVAAASGGHARFAAASAQPPPPVATLSGEHEITGVLRDDATVSGSLARLDLSVHTVDGAPSGGGLRLRMPAPATPLLAGDRIRVTANVEPPPVLAEFDYAGYLRSRGVHAVAAFPSSWELLERNTGPPPLRALRNLRRRAVANLERALPEPQAALAAGMLIGERRTMPAGVVEDLRLTGTSHLVVVSGQNIALLLGSAVALLAAVMSRRRAALLVLALLPAYVVLVGAEAPVVRAAIMAVGIAVAAASGRRTPGWLYLLYAAAAMLAVDPMLARDVAFQLSMSATAGIMLLAPPLRDYMLAALHRDSGGPLASLAELAATATAAAVAVLPVQAAVFERVSLLTVPANILVAPLYEATLVVAIAGAALGWFEPAAALISAAGRYAPAAFLAVAHALAALPGAEIPLRAPMAAGAAWYAAVAGLGWLLHRREPPVLAPGSRSGFAATAGLALVAGGVWLAALSPVDDTATVTVLDVGQGLAVLVQDRGASVLVDAGPRDGSVVGALARVGAGRTLDAVILTHEDSDHTGGLPALKRRLQVGHVLGAPGIAPEPLDIGDRVRLSARTTVEVLSPPLNAATSGHRDDNNSSLVILISIGDLRVLVTADIETPAERWLTASGLDLRADAVVVPHHGSASASSPEFVQAVAPQVALISVGASNPHGHPHEEVLERYREQDATVYRTDIHGDIVLRSDGQRLWLATARDGGP